MNQEYNDRSAAMAANSHEAIRKILREKFSELRLLADTAQKSAIRGVNCAREIGAQIELFTGHEILHPIEFEKIAVIDSTFEFAKTCLKLHHKFPEPVENPAIAEAEFSRVLVQLELLRAPERKKAVEQMLSEPEKELISKVIKITQHSVKVTADNPVEQWPLFLRQSFVREGAQFVQLYRKAQNTNIFESQRTAIAEIEADAPIERWPKEKVPEFLRIIQPVRQLIDRAEKFSKICGNP